MLAQVFLTFSEQEVLDGEVVENILGFDSYESPLISKSLSKTSARALFLPVSAAEMAKHDCRLSHALRRAYARG